MLTKVEIMSIDEYAIEAGRFAETLLEQREMRLAGGLYHLTQIELAYNSNRIEGSQLSEDQTRYLYETRTILGDALVDDVVETTNHFRAFDLVLASTGEGVSVNEIQELHRILKSGTRDAEREWFAVGDWKRVPNSVGGIETTAPEEVEAEMVALVSDYSRALSFEDICDFHVRFESIHPFQDGNGRVGRLIMFQQCLENNIMPFVVPDGQKAFYYRGLQRYDDTPGFLRDSFRSFQDEYFAKFAQYVPRVDVAAQQSDTAVQPD